MCIGYKLVEYCAIGFTGDEESIVSVARGMLLRLEESVEVPERALYEVVRRHFRKSAE